MADAGKALALVDEAKSIEAWGDKEQIRALGRRLKEVIPGWSKLKDEHAVSAAQYAAVTGANPARGEIYAYTDWKGNLQIVDGYKILIRWARRECNFYERYTAFTKDDKVDAGLSEVDIAYRCHILREDAMPLLKQLVDTGFPRDEAYEIAASSATGVVNHRGDMTSFKSGKKIPPPQGWSWDEVARKRALKNALNRAYGMPSMKEIAQETWTVDDTVTISEDWTDVSPDQPTHVQEQEAKLSAESRESAERVEDLSDEERQDVIAKGRSVLHGDPEDADWSETAPAKPSNGEDEAMDEISVALAKATNDEWAPGGIIQNRVQVVMKARGMDTGEHEFPMTVGQIREALVEVGPSEKQAEIEPDPADEKEDEPGTEETQPTPDTL
jgi:recombinational DNA repair protein RecT